MNLQTENRGVVVRGCGGGAGSGVQGFFWGAGSDLELTVVIAAQLCEYAENHQMVHVRNLYKWRTCVVCDVHVNKA